MDRTVEIGELLSHAGWRRQLAAQLVADAQAADDLVQDTWVAALRHPPARTDSVRQWLARVVRNLAHNARRDERVRRAHEAGGQAGSEPAARGPDALAEEAEAQRRLAEAVTHLAEPLRSVVVLRYLHGLESAATGGGLGRPAGTVRWRRAKALAELRAELERRAGGERGAWLVGLARLAQAQALVTAGAGAAPAGLATLAAGVLVALALGAGIWMLAARSDSRAELTSAPELVARASSEPASAAPTLDR